MKLHTHVARLIHLNPHYVENGLIGGLTILLETGITDSQESKKHEFLVTLLVFVCLTKYIAHRHRAFLPLRALLGYVFAHAPNAKNVFMQELEKSCPELKNALT